MKPPKPIPPSDPIAATATYQAHRAAIAEGAVCAGRWVARKKNNTASGAPAIPVWDPAQIEHPQAPVRVLAWQYGLDCYGAANSGPLDFNLANPAFQTEFLSRLLPAPAVCQTMYTLSQPAQNAAMVRKA